MARAKYYCEECVEEISQGDVFWENGRAYCGRCGGELDLNEDAADVVEHISTHKIPVPIRGTDDDDEDEDDDLERDELDQETEEDEEDEFGELDEDLEEDDRRR